MERYYQPEIETMPREQLKALQSERLVKQVKHVWDNVRGCDLARSAYAKYESGELNVKISVLIELKKIYECSYDDFFVGLDRETP